jgi:branched-chain amino acid transport system substrate-binding protein
MPSMTGWITSFVVLWACLGVATAQDAIVVGAVVSESGAHAGAAAEYRQGLLLWQDDTNAAGGLLGRRVELRLKDDGSEAVRAGPAYAELIEGGAQVLIGPYGSAATLTASSEAERGRRVLLNAAGPSSLVHKRAPRYVVQTSPPYVAYGEGVLELARKSGAESLYILGRDDAASREMAEAALALSSDLGFRQVKLAVYSGTTNDFLEQLYEAMRVQADAWIAFGEVRDGADMVKTLKRHGFVPKMLYARASAEPGFVQLVGQDAEHVLGSKEYDPRFDRGDNARFVKAYRAKWSAAPGALAAAAYTAGTVLAAAAVAAGSVEADKLRAALAKIEVDTLLGRYRIDPATGLQVGMQPAVVQRIEGRLQPLYPDALAGGREPAPFAPWAGRKIIR